MVFNLNYSLFRCVQALFNDLDYTKYFSMAINLHFDTN